jgi:hypothetical protein
MEQKIDHSRILTYAFLTLPYHVRITIVRDLGLVKGKAPLSQEDFFAKCFSKARTDKKLPELWDAVYKESPDDQRRKMGVENPFRPDAKPAEDPADDFYSELQQTVAGTIRDLQTMATQTGEVQVAKFSTNGWKDLPNGKGRIRIDSIEITVEPLKH